jgi:hypothetical protein
MQPIIIEVLVYPELVEGSFVEGHLAANSFSMR